MQPAPGISLRPLTQPEGEPPRSEVLRDGQPLGAQIDGVVLEAALTVADGYLLFSTDDVPHEDMLSITLLDSAGHTLDAARIGGPYSTGHFDHLRSVPPDTVHFRFSGGMDWTLHVLPAPRWRLPFSGDAPGVHRPLGFTRRFVVSAQPARL
jgi:hypothetical protein